MQHALIRDSTLESRIYQEVIAARAAEKGNTLVVAPTALGKTVVAMLLAAHVLRISPESKVIFLAPTKPLAVQHERSFRKFMNIEEGIALVTGTTPVKERAELWENARLISATPQTLENDIIAGRAKLGNVGLMIFDEAHRAVGDYSYVFIAKMYMKSALKPLILGLTASPGSEEAKIDDVCRHLFIQNIEVKTPQDLDVKPYTKEIEIEWVRVELPEEFMEIKRLLEGFMKEQLEVLKKFGVAKGVWGRGLSKRILLEMQARVRKRLATKAASQPSLYVAISKIAALLKVSHAHTLLETQGIQALHDYFGRMQEQSAHAGASKALISVLSDLGIRKAIAITERLNSEGVMHPKILALKDVLLSQLKSSPESKVLVFNHYRDSVGALVRYLSQFPEVKASAFIGQADKGENKGMTQARQSEVLNALKGGEFNTLVATSVAEEGLDIPAVDLVVFFEPVPSEIRTIQRRGRTGRFSKGRVVILMAKNTRDEAFHWSSIAKEKRMHRALKELRGAKAAGLGKEGMHGAAALEKQSTLMKFAETQKDSIVVYADTREQASPVVRILTEKGINVNVKQLEVGDYLLSDDVAVERKTTEDFLQSIIDGRLFSQAIKLANNFSKPLMVVEGSIDELFTLRNIHRNAVMGALTSLALDYRTPLLFTKDADETAEYLCVIARREQLGKEKDIRLRVGRKGLALSEQQLFVVESLPMVGPNMARKLLERFGSVRQIANADEKELQKVENLGEKKAEAIKRVLWGKYGEKGG